MSRRYSSSLISKWLTGIDALWWIHYRIPLWGVRCSWAKLSRCRYPDSNVECKACKAAIRWVCSVKAEDLEEIARVGEEPLPPYPMEEITDWTWAILGLETQRFSQVSQYSKIWTMSIRLDTRCSVYVWTLGVRTASTLQGVFWASFHCWWPSILVPIGISLSSLAKKT